MDELATPSRRPGPGLNLLVGLLVLLAILAGAYYALRFAGWTMESDANLQAVSADGILATGRLVFPRTYSNGFGYAAQLAFTSLVTGIGLNPVQLASGAWVFVLLLFGFVTFRELLGNPYGGALATFLLLIQPDFLFYVVRGSHERSTWTCALLMLFFLARSYHYAASPGKLATHVLLFYLAFWGMAGGNVYFASTFMIAITLSLALGWGYERLFVRRSRVDGTGASWHQRLLLVAVTCLVIVFIYINYAYQPALQIYFTLNTLVDRIGVLLFGAEPLTEPAAYTYFGAAWRSQPIYLALTGAQWALALASLGTWLWLMLRLSRLEANKRLLWQLYTAFGALLAFSLVADYSAFLSSNMQMRLFTPFALFISALTALGVVELWPRLSPAARRRLAPAAALLAVLVFVAAQVKITNDPAVGNQWLFYTPQELQAMQWAKSKVASGQIWLDPWGHLQHSFSFTHGYSEQLPFDYRYQALLTEYPYVLITQLTRLHANRIEYSPPSTSGYLQIYDNGVSQLYHRRPHTPYQR